MVIPDTLGGFPVTSIGSDAFYENFGLTGVTIPNSVTNIGDRAFIFCSGLANVIIPDSVTSIGDKAFNFCTSLTSVTIPNSVTSIGDSAFYYCSKLTGVTIPDSVTSIGDAAFGAWHSLTSISVATNNPVYSSVSGVLFDKLQTRLLQFPAGLAGSYVIPDSVTNIRAGAFSGCHDLANVTIPDSVTSIGDSAFVECTSLTSITIKNSVTTIGEFTFFYCINLRSVTIGSGVSSIGEVAFGNCWSLTAAYFQGDAPPDDGSAFLVASATVYYLPGTTGWGATFGGRPAVLWNPRILTDDGMFGVHAGQFGFTFMGAADVRVAIEACSDLSNPDWTTVAHLTCGPDGTVQFTEPEAADHPVRIYRFRPE